MSMDRTQAPLWWNLQDIKTLLRTDGTKCHMMVVSDSIGSRGNDTRHFGAISRNLTVSRYVGFTTTNRGEDTTYDGTTCQNLGATSREWFSPKPTAPFDDATAADEECWITGVEELESTASLGNGTQVFEFRTAIESGMFSSNLFGASGSSILGNMTNARGIHVTGSDASLALGENLRWRAHRGGSDTSYTGSTYQQNTGTSGINILSKTLPAGSTTDIIGGNFAVGTNGWVSGDYCFPVTCLLYDSGTTGFQLDVVGASGTNVRNFSSANGTSDNMISSGALDDYLTATRDPNLICIYLGQNDGSGELAHRYIDDVEDLIAKFRTASDLGTADLYFLLIAPPRDNKTDDPGDGGALGDDIRYAEYARRLFEVARDDANGTVGFVNAYALTRSDWPTKDTAGDDIHPSTDAEADKFWIKVDWAMDRGDKNPNRNQ